MCGSSGWFAAQRPKGSSDSKLGTVGRMCGQASARPQMSPVPRGPKIHLCIPATKKSAPSVAAPTSLQPKPCNPSTISRQRSASSRPALAAPTTSASAAIGSRSPVLECTHVRPTARVRGVIARRSLSSITSARAPAAPSWSAMRRTLAPFLSDASRIDSWCE